MAHACIISEELVKVAHDIDFWMHYFFYCEPGRSYPDIVNCRLKVAEEEFGFLRSEDEMEMDEESESTLQDVGRILIPVTGTAGFIIDITPELDRTIALYREGSKPIELGIEERCQPNPDVFRWEEFFQIHQYVAQLTQDVVQSSILGLLCSSFTPITDTDDINAITTFVEEAFRKLGIEQTKVISQVVQCLDKRGCGAQWVQNSNQDWEFLQSDQSRLTNIDKWTKWEKKRPDYESYEVPSDIKLAYSYRKASLNVFPFSDFRVVMQAIAG